MSSDKCPKCGERWLGKPYTAYECGTQLDGRQSERCQLAAANQRIAELERELTAERESANAKIARALDERDEARRELAAKKEKLAEAEQENRRLTSWEGLMSVLDQHYPADVRLLSDISGESGSGPRIVALMRAIDQARAKLAEVEEKNTRLRRILAHVPACFALQAKEAAGYGERIVPMSYAEIREETTDENDVREI